MGNVNGIGKQERERALRGEKGEEAILFLPPVAADVRILYGGDPFQFADLWLPKNAKLRPVVVAIHGGYWRAQYGLGHIARLCMAIARYGYATYSIEYRRVGNSGGGYPGTFLDVGTGVDHLRSIAQAHALDLSRVVTLGHSAGGQLALWTAARRRVRSGSEVAFTDPLPLAGAISLAGVVDLQRASELQLSSGAADELLGGRPDEVGERYRATSPIELVPIGTPQYLIHGTKDNAVPPELSRRYYEAARAAGDPVSLTMVEGKGHFALIDPEDDAFDIVLQTIERALASPARS